MPVIYAAISSYMQFLQREFALNDERIHCTLLLVTDVTQMFNI